MLKSALIAAGIAVFLVAAPGTASAHPGFAYAAAPQARVSLDQAVSIARRRVDGRVVGADTRTRRGRVVHEVKILTDDGTVRVVRVDGETGRASH